MRTRLILSLLLVSLALASPALAQNPSPRDELLRCVPPDHGICFSVNDLSGHAERWRDLRWVKSLAESQLAKSLVATAEFAAILKVQNDLKRHLGVDWPTLRDDVLGDALVFAFRPGRDNKPEDEQGLIMVQARKGQVVAALVGGLNEIQKKNGELQDLAEREHLGIKYFRRQTNKATQFYLLRDGFLAFTGAEDTMRFVIERRQTKDAKPSALGAQLAKAGADKSLLSLSVNPRLFVGELKAKAQGQGPEAAFLKLFLAYWQALDAVVVSFHAGDQLELRLTLLAPNGDLPVPARKLFREKSQPSDVWLRFPDRALFTMAGRLNLSALLDSVAEASPPELRAVIFDGLKKSIGAALGMNALKDVLPNLGPDWGVCVLPAVGAKEWPHVLAALAVKPGAKEVDQAMLKGMNLLAGWAVFFYNQNHPDDPMQLGALVQDKVEVKYLVSDRAFPAGFQPAFALKDGYLLLATSPMAIARFKPGAGRAPTGDDAPIMRLSVTEIAKLMRGKRQAVTDHIAEKNQITPEAAGVGLDGALSILDLIERIELTERAGVRLVTWTLRIQPK